MEERITREGLSRIEFISRVHVRAIFAGVMVTFGCLAILMGFSWAIGLSTFAPTADHARGLALGNEIWGAIALWISLFVGGFVASLVSRSIENRDGLLHGLVVWGTVSAFLGLVIILFFGGLLGGLARLSGAAVSAGAPPAAVGGAARSAIGNLAQMAGITTWLYWAGVVGGLITGLFGGLLGSRTEERAPVARRAVRAPVGPVAPQPT